MRSQVQLGNEEGSATWERGGKCNLGTRGEGAARKGESWTILPDSHPVFGGLLSIFDQFKALESGFKSLEGRFKSIFARFKALGG